MCVCKFVCRPTLCDCKCQVKVQAVVSVSVWLIMSRLLCTVELMASLTAENRVNLFSCREVNVDRCVFGLPSFYHSVHVTEHICWRQFLTQTHTRK